MAALVTPEYKADLASTTVGVGGYTAGSGSLTVVSAAALSTTRQFHFMITDQTTGAVKCIGKATAVSSNTFTVVMSTDANANAADVVTISLCSGAMNQILADLSGLPSYGDPNAGSWSSLNSPSDLSQTNGVHYVRITGNSTFQGRYQAAPATPYNLYARLKAINAAGGDGASGVGIFNGDAAGNVEAQMYLPNGGVLGVRYYSTSGAANGAPSGTLQPFGVSMNFSDALLRIQNDGTNLTYYISPDGYNWYQLYQHVVGASLGTITRVGFGGYFSNGNYFNQASLINWVAG